MTTSYPTADRDLHQLVNEHLKIHDEPLLLAVYYAPAREPLDIFLFEVIDGFGANSIDEEKRIFEVTYASQEGFPLQPGQRLHLLLTNPVEFEIAMRDGWQGVAELRTAIARGDFRIIYESPDRPELLRQLKI